MLPYPPIYFGGASDAAIRVAGRPADVDALCGETHAQVAEITGRVRAEVARHERQVDDPVLLILDELLGKPDNLARLQMQAELVRIWRDRGFAALLVTHDVEAALLANRVIVVGDRPAPIRAGASVPLACPRHRDAPELVRPWREHGDRGAGGITVPFHGGSQEADDRHQPGLG